MMDPIAASIAALLLTGCVGGTIVACIIAAENYGKPQPPCRRCGDAHADHEQRFGDPGHCHVCFGCYRYER